MIKPNGPYPISEVSYWVRSNAMGVFMLARNRESVDYIGHSESDLKSNIEKFTTDQKRYKWFLFRYAMSPRLLFHIECQWYHFYSPRDNISHPNPPTGVPLKCTVEECEL